VDLGGDRAATRSYDRTLRALGFRGCAGASFSKKIHTQQLAEDVTMDITNEPGSEAILMRDRQGAAKALPVLRRMLLQSFTAGGLGQAHSIPAPGLGAQAPRGIQVTYNLGEPFGTLTGSFYLWRRGPVVGWVGSGHVEGEFDEARTLELARRLDSRIAA
jgi:hypothetical protein